MGEGSRLQRFVEDLPKVVDQLETTLASIDALSKEGTKTAGSIREFSDNANKRLDTTLSGFDAVFQGEHENRELRCANCPTMRTRSSQSTLSSVDDFSKESTKNRELAA